MDSWSNLEVVVLLLPNYYINRQPKQVLTAHEPGICVYLADSTSYVALTL